MVWVKEVVIAVEVVVLAGGVVEVILASGVVEACRC